MESKRLSRREFLRWSAVVAGTTVLAACAPATPAPTEPPADEPEVEEPEVEEPIEEAPPGLEGEIEYWSYDLGPANESRESIREAFMADNPGADVKLTFLPYGETYEKLVSLMAAGSPPDVIYGDFQLIRHVLAGEILPITELFEADPILTDPDLWTMDMRDPFIAKFGMPEAYNLILGTWVPILYYNRELFDNAGEDYPDESWTWEDLRAVSKNLTIPEEDQFGVSFGTGIDTAGYVWWSTEPGHFWAVPQTWPEKTDWNNDSGLTTCSVFYDLGFVDKSLIPRDVSGEYQVTAGAFGAGKVGMHIGGDWDAGWGYRDLAIDWDMTFVPKVKEGYRPSLNCTIAYGCIAKATQNVDLAWAWTRHMSATKEAQIAVGQGAFESPVLLEAAHSDEVLHPDWGVPGYDTRVKAAELAGPMYCPYALSLNMWEYSGKFWDPTEYELRRGEKTPQEAVEYLDAEGTPHYQRLLEEMPEMA